MTKITKSEKLLREATSKWNKFLKEGAFAQEETLEEGGTMGEYGKMDAEQGLPPTKVGRGNEEYMAAYNAVLQARGEEPMDIQQPDQAYLDALRSGQLEENEKKKFKLKESNMEMSLQSKAKGKAMRLLQTAKAMAQAPSTEPAKGFAAAVSKDAGEIVDLMVELEGFQASRTASLQENEKTFKVGEFVRIVGGSLKGATGKILEPVTTMKGEEGFAIELYSDAKMRVFGQKGDEVIATADDMESGGTTDGMELYDIDEKLSAADKEFHKSVMDKGKVPNLKGDMGPLPGLEGPFQFRSGAVLYYDPKAGAYYDRGKDMYLDREEAAELTMENVEGGDGLENARQLIAFARKTIDKDLDFEYELKENSRIDWEDIVKSLSRAERLVLEHQDEMKNMQEMNVARTTMSSDPEMDQIEDIALSVIEKFGGLMGIASKLEDQGFDASVANGTLSIDGKYFMGKEDNFDISPDEDVRKVGKYVLGYMG